MVRHRVRDEADTQLVGDLAHDGRLSNSRGSNKEQGPLRSTFDAVHSHFVDRKICFDGVLSSFS